MKTTCLNAIMNHVKIKFLKVQREDLSSGLLAEIPKISYTLEMNVVFPHVPLIAMYAL